MGTWDGAALTELGDAVELIHGPQGGQHVFISAELWTERRGSFRFWFELSDLESGALLGAGQRDRDRTSCPLRVEDVPVFLESDNEVTGSLSVWAEESDCTIAAEPVTLSILSPEP